MITGK